ncbi:MAG TPA: molybdopterin synthase sulfur carrier subunit [Planctomycetales bacterium]|jgi:MoaD family protein|nr:molybdopterin synthase sulfur carrier subunit [Planctomycetales bacterium]
MTIKIQIPTPMRQHADGKTTVEVAGATVQAALADLSAKYPAIAERVFKDGKVRQFINVYLNNEDIRYLDSLATPVKDGDELAIIPAVAGG